MHETPMTTALALLSALLYAAAPPLLAVVQARDPHHDTVRDPVSDYALGTARGLFQWHGHLGTLAAALMAGVMHLAGLPGWLVACMAAVVLARIGVLLFPTDLEGAPKTASGRLHMGFAVASFALYYTVADNATPLLAPRRAARVGRRADRPALAVRLGAGGPGRLPAAAAAAALVRLGRARVPDRRAGVVRRRQPGHRGALT